MFSVRALSGIASLTLVLTVASGCGSSDDGAPAQQAKAPTPTTGSPTPRDAGVTAGGLGDSSTAKLGGGKESATPGGDVDPDAVLSGGGSQQGVGAQVACVGADALPADSSLLANDKATLCLLNAERAAHGMAPLSSNPELGKAAQAYAATMVAKKFFGHVGPDGSTMVARVKKTGYLKGTWSIGENLAWGSGELATPRAIVAAWMKSPGHRANILTPKFRHIGLALASGTPNGDAVGATYVNEFGTNGTKSISLTRR